MGNFSSLPKPILRINELAYNLWFSWQTEALSLFQQIDPVLWEQTGHNPVRMLQEAEPGKLQERCEDTNFMKSYERVIQKFDEYKNGSTWFQANYKTLSYVKIAYFSAEFGFHESLPIYSGGLGILAGDHIKSASDLGLPLVGVGLLYKQGYFQQKIDANGRQQAERIDYDFSKLPLLPVMNGEKELILGLELPGRIVSLKVWQVQVGRNSVYLLDADLAKNHAADRELTAQLYGGNQDTRIAQEIVLGMGGVKALRALGMYPNVYHINEGHAAFLTLERLRELMQSGLSFGTAVETVRAATVFTTHTPVPAGHDAFPIGMVEHHLGPYLSLFPSNRQAILALGLDRQSGLFNMTHLALNTAALRNGVSKLHGKVSREMFRDFHGQIDTMDVPIGAITNGVHMPTWMAPEWKELLDGVMPGDWQQQQANKVVWDSVEHIPSSAIWKVHQQLKDSMIRYARHNLKEQRRRNGDTEEKLREVESYLSPRALTIGFARRFATYKRANLIFNDLIRLKKLILNLDRPVQFIFAGKAHPADGPGQEMIRDIYRVSQMQEFTGRIVLLENYDMNMARYLVQGVDVWLNNPRRPLEASGTSGQKAAMNGVINFSVLDGWWEEGYNGDNGWAIGSSDDVDWDTQEKENTESIYRILETEIIPLYFDQGALPNKWVDCMKRSIQTLSPQYNTDRMVQDYAEQTYFRTAERAAKFVENGYDAAKKVADYKEFIRNNWHQVKILSVDDRAAKKNAVPEPPGLDPKVQTKVIYTDVYFGPIWHLDTAVEIIYYEDNKGSWDPIVVSMQPTAEVSPQIQRYAANIPVHLLHGPHFSVRVRPISANFAHPFELPLVTSTLRR